MRRLTRSGGNVIPASSNQVTASTSVEAAPSHVRWLDSSVGSRIAKEVDQVDTGAGDRRIFRQVGYVVMRKRVAPPSSISPLRRLRHRVRTQIFEYPAIYMPFARYKYRGHSPEVISAETELVIDGYFRSANTFSVHAFQMSQERPVKLAHHLHAPAQLITAARRGIPVLLLLRNPEGAILSELLYDNVALPDALDAYTRFHTCLLPYLDSFVVGEFEQVTHDFGSVIRQVNERFGTSFAEFKHTDETTRECFELMNYRGTLSEIVYSFESGVIDQEELRRKLPDLARQPQPEHFREAWIPSEDRARSKPALRERWLDPSMSQRRERAESVYRQVLAASPVASAAS